MVDEFSHSAVRNNPQILDRSLHIVLLAEPKLMSTLTANARCVLTILEDAGPLTTSEILKYAQSTQYAELCSDCAGGDAFVAAANQLVDRGLVTREFGKGGYRWQLTRK